MSVLFTVTSQLTAVPITAAGEGILDWAGAKNAEAITALRGFAVTLGIVFVMWQALASRGAMARILVSGLAAGVFVWVVFNVTDIRDRVGDEVNSSAPATQSAPPRAAGV